MWSNNKTSEWLKTLSEQDHTKVIDDARKHAPCIAKLIKAKQQSLHAKKVRHLHERQQQKKKLPKGNDRSPESQQVQSLDFFFFFFFYYYYYYYFIFLFYFFLPYNGRLCHVSGLWLQ